jgi:uncharacterized protein (DUF2147 family)
MLHRLGIGLAALAVVLIHTPAMAASPSGDPVGTWLTENGVGRIRIEQCVPDRKAICGFAVWMKKATDEDGHPLRDSHNPDPQKRSRPLLGHQMILDLKPNDEGRYEGEIYNAENGKNYDVTLWVEDSGELRVKGCFLRYLCGSQSWTRVTDIVPGELSGPTGGPKGPRRDAE